MLLKNIKKTKDANVKVTRGGLGLVNANLGTKGPKLMFAAHMDEVGFMWFQELKKRIFNSISHWRLMTTYSSWISN